MAERKIKMGAFKNFRARMRRIKALYNEAKEMDALYAGWRYQLGAPSDAPVERYLVSPYSIGKARNACKVGNRDLVVTVAEVPLLVLGELGEDIIESYGPDRLNTDTMVGVTLGIRDYFIKPDRSSEDSLMEEESI